MFMDRITIVFASKPIRARRWDVKGIKAADRADDVIAVCTYFRTLTLSTPEARLRVIAGLAVATRNIHMTAGIGAHMSSNSLLPPVDVPDQTTRVQGKPLPCGRGL